MGQLQEGEAPALPAKGIPSMGFLLMRFIVELTRGKNHAPENAFITELLEGSVNGGQGDVPYLTGDSRINLRRTQRVPGSLNHIQDNLPPLRQKFSVLQGITFGSTVELQTGITSTKMVSHMKRRLS